MVLGCVIFLETSWYKSRKLFGGLKNRLVVMPDVFEEIKAVHWPLAFLTYLLRNLQLVLGCAISGETSWVCV